MAVPYRRTARCRVVLMMMVCNLICYVDRTNIAVAIVSMSAE